MRKSLYQDFPQHFTSYQREVPFSHLTFLCNENEARALNLSSLGRGDKLTNGFGTFKISLSFLSRRVPKLKVTAVYLP